METRFKERLIGAIALVTIVVIVVPELLTGPHPPSAPTPASGATPVRTVTIDLAAPERGAISHAPTSTAAASVPAATPAGGPPTSPPSTGPTAAPGGGSVLTVQPTASGPPPAAPAPATAAPGTGAPGSEQAAPTAAPPVAPPAPAVAARAATGWVVQLGSFAGRGNAERLATSLRAKGYAAFVAEFRASGRVLYRVRVGPEQDRARAEAVAARLAREGHRGSVAPQT
ncbi:MAG TPA: SPOR domain-containing protein [Steroidobacteraceae bacterium]|nr:SPOR domain-containing protein [Steroidobacteraceae bacterium]